MKINIVILKFFLSLVLPLCAVANQSGDDAKLTETIRANWPYEAFLAIPRVAELKPIISIELLDFRKQKIATKCLDIDYFEITKKYDREAVLDREPLHRLLCKAVKRALEKSRMSEFNDVFNEKETVGLRFDFSKGRVEFAEIPFPPMDPHDLLEDFFIDENHEDKFGDIDFPTEFVSEIKETSL